MGAVTLVMCVAHAVDPVLSVALVLMEPLLGQPAKWEGRLQVTSIREMSLLENEAETHTS